MRNTLRGVLRLIDHTRAWPAILDQDAPSKLNRYADLWLRRAGEAAQSADAEATNSCLPTPGRTTELVQMDWVGRGAVLAEQLMTASGISVTNPIGDALRRAVCAGYAWRLGEVTVTGEFSPGTDAPHVLGLASLMRRAADWGQLAASDHVPTFRHVTNALLGTPMWESELARQVDPGGSWEQQKGWVQVFTTPRATEGRDLLVVSGTTEINAEAAFVLFNGRPYSWEALCSWMAGAPPAD